MYPPSGNFSFQALSQMFHAQPSGVQVSFGMEGDWNGRFSAMRRRPAPSTISTGRLATPA